MSKIGEHAYSTTSWTSRAGIVMAFNCGPGPLQAAPPGAWRFYRKYMGEWQARNGAEVVREVLASLDGYRHPKLCIQLYVGPDQSNIVALADQIEQAAAECRAQGVGLAAPSFYTGQPEAAVWQYMAGRNWCGLDPQRDCIAVQEYTNNGTVNNPVNVGRFTAVIDAGWSGRIAVLEAGMDVDGTPLGGWRGRLTEDQFYAYLRAYDDLLQRYPQVLGATVFNAPGWPSFEFHDPRSEFNLTPEDNPVIDPAIQQVLDQNALIADALYDLTKIIAAYPTSQPGGPFAAAVQDAKTKVNALNPSKFAF